LEAVFIHNLALVTEISIAVKAHSLPDISTVNAHATNISGNSEWASVTSPDEWVFIVILSYKEESNAKRITPGVSEEGGPRGYGPIRRPRQPQCCAEPARDQK
jgi:hypothetical protein